MKILSILLTVLRQELYVIYVGSPSVTVAEDIAALYHREENSIFKCISAFMKHTLQYLAVIYWCSSITPFT